MLWKVTLFSTLTILAVFFLGKMGNIVSRTIIVIIGLLSIFIFPLLRIAVKRGLVKLGVTTDLPLKLVPQVKLEFCYFLFFNAHMLQALEESNLVSCAA
jgi:hypothetical protein